LEGGRGSQFSASFVKKFRRLFSARRPQSSHISEDFEKEIISAWQFLYIQTFCYNILSFLCETFIIAGACRSLSQFWMTVGELICDASIEQPSPACADPGTRSTLHQDRGSSFHTSQYRDPCPRRAFRRSRRHQRSQAHSTDANTLYSHISS
jgi:hypothetical protein